MLHTQQQEAFDAVLQFIQTPGLRFFRLAGYAGTGKTFLTKALSQHELTRFALYTATTNQATKVLSLALGDRVCKTIFSALGVKMVSDEDQMVLEFPKRVPDFIAGFNLIFIDEASMLAEDMVEFIKLVSVQYNIKFVLIADRAQNPPVGEIDSRIWYLSCPEYELTHVVRYDNQILRIATHVRRQVFKCPEHRLKIRSDHSATEGVWRKDHFGLLRAIQKAASAGRFKEINHTKIVAWRNKTVDEYNQLIRLTMYGPQSREPYIEGDRIMIRKPVHYGKKILFHIDEEGTILKVGLGYHGVYRTIDCFHLTILFDDGRSSTLTVVTPDAQPALDSVLNDMAIEAKKDKTKWGAFWAFNNAFHKIAYSYALTVHRAQGSTFRNVLVDRQDILTNIDEFNALRCLYVAYSRPTNILVTT